MAHTLYELQAGSVRRKVYDEDGKTVVSVSYKKGHTFVPSPSEYNANKDRLKPVATVETDSPEVALAILNNNSRDFPEFGKKNSKSTHAGDDIREVKDTAHAVALALAAIDEETLDKYAVQEADNKPRVRKAVLNSIEKRRVELQQAKNLKTENVL